MIRSIVSEGGVVVVGLLCGGQTDHFSWPARSAPRATGSHRFGAFSAGQKRDGAPAVTTIEHDLPSVKKTDRPTLVDNRNTPSKQNPRVRLVGLHAL